MKAALTVNKKATFAENSEKNRKLIFFIFFC
jgi:hypothetical protein